MLFPFPSFSPVTRAGTRAVTHLVSVDGATVHGTGDADQMGADCEPEGARIEGVVTSRSGDAGREQGGDHHPATHSIESETERVSQ